MSTTGSHQVKRKWERNDNSGITGQLSLLHGTVMSSCQERPKSANPQRRLRTATHKVTLPRRNSDSSQTQVPSQRINRMEIQPEEPEPQEETDPISTRLVNGRTALHPTASCDSMLMFECVQKASALRVLAKTWDRQRDVAAVTSEMTQSEASAAPAYRKSSPPPRKLRPLNR